MPTKTEWYAWLRWYVVLVSLRGAAGWFEMQEAPSSRLLDEVTSTASAINAASAQSKSFGDKEGFLELRISVGCSGIQYVHLKLLPDSGWKIWQHLRRPWRSHNIPSEQPE
jgi:hypothetical protein